MTDAQRAELLVLKPKNKTSLNKNWHRYKMAAWQQQHVDVAKMSPIAFLKKKGEHAFYVLSQHKKKKYTLKTTK